MKRILFSFTLVLSSFIVFAQDRDQSKGLVEVPRYYGVFVFDGLKPYYSYEVLDDIKGKSSFARDASNQSYDERIKVLAKKAKDKYPDCEGIILDMKGGTMSADRAEIIKFKK